MLLKPKETNDHMSEKEQRDLIDQMGRLWLSHIDKRLDELGDKFEGLNRRVSRLEGSHDNDNNHGVTVNASQGNVEETGTQRTCSVRSGSTVVWVLVLVIMVLVAIVGWKFGQITLK